MKQFIVDRHTAPLTPTLEQVPTEKIPTYESLTDAESDLTNLNEGQIIATLDDGADELLKTVDTVEDNNMHPVTSNAVAESISYSETEQATGGKWIDGKPIYRKVYYSATNWTQYQVIDTIAISKLINITSISTDNNGNVMVNSNSIGDNSAYISGQNLRALRSSGFVNTSPSTIIIEYTKTTD